MLALPRNVLAQTSGDYESDIPNYFTYARNFALADAFFSSLEGPSFPNHLYTVGAQSNRAINNPSNSMGPPLPLQTHPRSRATGSASATAARTPRDGERRGRHIGSFGESRWPREGASDLRGGCTATACLHAHASGFCLRWVGPCVSPGSLLGEIPGRGRGWGDLRGRPSQQQGDSASPGFLGLLEENLGPGGRGADAQCARQITTSDGAPAYSGKVGGFTGGVAENWAAECP
jgi:hypothetical protein